MRLEKSLVRLQTQAVAAKKMARAEEEEEKVLDM